MDDRPRFPRDDDEGFRILGDDEEPDETPPDRRPAEPRRASRVEESDERPSLRFPLAAGDQPTPQVRAQASGPPPRDPDEEQDAPGESREEQDRPGMAPPADDTPLPHWTEPATGEVPESVRRPAAGDESDDDLDAWSSFATGAPRWRDQPSDWDEPDFSDVSRLGDESTRLGAMARPEPTPVAEPPPAVARPAPAVDDEGDDGSGSRFSGPGRDVRTAVLTAAAFAVVALFVLSQGPGWTALLVTAVIVLAAAELFSALTKAKFHPATLIGLIGSGGMVAGAYWKGEGAIPLVMGLVVVFTMLWYLAGVTRARPVANIAVTIAGVGYVGLLGSFGTLMLKWPNGDGTGLLLGAILVTVAYDTIGFFVGSRIGQRHLASEVSPNKTYEGLAAGMAGAVLVSVLIVSFIRPWSFGSALALGLVAALMAPLGDLAESMVKRDLRIKDMGSVLPGHGGFLDRFDAILFVLPATYYLALALELSSV